MSKIELIPPAYWDSILETNLYPDLYFKQLSGHQHLWPPGGALEVEKSPRVAIPDFIEGEVLEAVALMHHWSGFFSDLTVQCRNCGMKDEQYKLEKEPCFVESK